MPFDILVAAAVSLPAIAAAGAGYAARVRKSRVSALEAEAHRVWSLTGELLCELELDGRIVRTANTFDSELGYAKTALTGCRLADLTHPDDAPAMLAALNPLGGEDGVRTFDARVRTGEGTWRALRWRAEVDAAAGTVHAAARPPGSPGERERALSAFELALAGSPIGMAVIDARGRLVRTNSKLCELVGRVEQELVGLQLDDLVHPEDLVGEHEQMARLQAGELSAVTTNVRVMAGERAIPVTLSVSLVRDDAGEPHEYIIQVRDASERQRLQERVRFEADHDALTGLLNRRAFAAVLDHHVAYASRYHRDAALVVLDVDGLREVNEAYGHSVGDSVLESVARSLCERLRETDAIARLGGDEFGVMLPEIDGVAARRIATELLAGAGERAVSVGGAGEPLVVTISAGIALFGAESRDSEQLFTNADLALLEAKEEGRGMWVVFDGGVRQRRTARNSRRSWAEKLRSGLESDAFLLDAQPIVEIVTGEAVQYELLLRLRDDDGAIVRPNTFLYIAERYGLMRAIDEWVVRRAIALARARVEIGDPVTLAVNVSGESVADPALLPLIVSELMDTPDIGQHLVLEISERTAVADIDVAKRLIARLEEFGCRFALDDFGTGSGSLSYLKHLPVDYLKLDGEFTRGLPADRADREIVAAVVQAAKGLGKTVIAECVEDEEILCAVRSFGIELAQGLHVGRPGRASELLDVEGALLLPPRV